MGVRTAVTIVCSFLLLVSCGGGSSGRTDATGCQSPAYLEPGCGSAAKPTCSRFDRWGLRLCLGTICTRGLLSGRGWFWARRRSVVLRRGNGVARRRGPRDGAVSDLGTGLVLVLLSFVIRRPTHSLCSRTDTSVASLPLPSAAERQYRWTDEHGG